MRFCLVHPHFRFELDVDLPRNRKAASPSVGRRRGAAAADVAVVDAAVAVVDVAAVVYFRFPRCFYAAACAVSASFREPSTCWMSRWKTKS